MKFCPIDGRAMVRDTTTGVVIFKCTTCGNEEAGTVEDVKIKSELFGKTELIDKYGLSIKMAPFDRTTHKFQKKCENCGREYMTQISVGQQDKIIIHRCKCMSILSDK